jgi:hypothetical protein
VSFASPVAIDANTTYVASYHAPNGNYASSTGYFAGGGFDSPPLHALGDGFDGANGIYKYGPSGGLFSGGGPDTFESSNYWVDVVFETEPPDTQITSGPAGATNDPTPTFGFTSSQPGSTFSCKVDSSAYGSCTSPKTTARLADGSHTFFVRAKDVNGDVDPTPASRSFTVRTAAIHISGSTLVVQAAPGAKDNLAITRPSPSVLRISDSPAGAFTGSGVHAFAGCTRSGERAANCNAAGVTLVQVLAGDSADQVTNSTATGSSLNGATGGDTLVGGSVADTLTGGTGLDVLRGMDGNDRLLGRDLASDTTIDCDGGTTPGTADSADLDTLPRDSSPAGCETVTRH